MSAFSLNFFPYDCHPSKRFQIIRHTPQAALSDPTSSNTKQALNFAVSKGRIDAPKAITDPISAVLTRKEEVSLPAASCPDCPRAD